MPTPTSTPTGKQKTAKRKMQTQNAKQTAHLLWPYCLPPYRAYIPHTPTHIRTHTQTNTRAYTHTHTHTRAHTSHTPIHIRPHTHTHTHARTNCTRTYFTYTHIRTPTHTHARTHTHTHTHTHVTTHARTSRGQIVRLLAVHPLPKLWVQPPLNDKPAII
jgi:hypothetical protein